VSPDVFHEELALQKERDGGFGRVAGTFGRSQAARAGSGGLVWFGRLLLFLLAAGAFVVAAGPRPAAVGTARLGGQLLAPLLLLASGLKVTKALGLQSLSLLVGLALAESLSGLGHGSSGPFQRRRLLRRRFLL